MLGIAVVDVLPSDFHAVDFFFIFELAEEGGFELVGSRAGNDAGDVHVWVASAGKTEIDKANDFVVLIEKNIAEVEIAMNEILLVGGTDKSVIFV